MVVLGGVSGLWWLHVYSRDRRLGYSNRAAGLLRQFASVKGIFITVTGMVGPTRIYTKQVPGPRCQ